MWLADITLEKPNLDSIIDAWVIQQSKALQDIINKIVVYFPRNIPQSPKKYPQLLGNVTSLSSSNRLFCIDLTSDPPNELSIGRMIVSCSPTLIRPYVSEDNWKQKHRNGTLMLRGPNSAEEITNWWENLKQPDCKISQRGKTWFINSPYRKRDAPAREKGWILVPGGACFRCGKLGHSEKNCRCGTRKCKKCYSYTHSQEACPYNKITKTPFEIYRSIKDIADIAKSCNNVTPEVCRLTDELMAVVKKLPKRFSPPISPNKSRPRSNKNGVNEKKNEKGDKTELAEARRVKNKNAAPPQNSVESTSMEETNEVLTQSSGSQLKKNQPSSEQSQEKAEIKNNTEQKNTDTSGSGSSKGTAEKDSGNKTMADKVQSPPGDVTCASPQSTLAKVLPFQQDRKKTKKPIVVNATNNKASNEKKTKK